MIIGIGTDMTDTRRIRAVLARFGSRFEARVFTPAEIALAEARRSAKVAALARRFAGKEAVLKALGTGARHGIALKDVEILSHVDGAPTVTLHGVAAEHFRARIPVGMRGIIHVSLADETHHALAFAVLEAQ